MLVAGVVLVVLSLLVVLLILVGGTPSFALSIGGVTWSTNSAGVFLTGMLVMLVLALGGFLLFLGTRRQARRSQEVRRLRRSAAQSTDTAAELPAQADTADGPTGRGPEDASLRDPSTDSDDAAADREDDGPTLDDPDEVRPRPLGRHHGDGER